MEFRKRKLDGRPFGIIGKYRVVVMTDDQDADPIALPEDLPGLST